MKNVTENRRTIELVIIVLLMLLLLVSLYQVMLPFFGVFAYVLILSVPLHAPFERLVKFLGNRRKLAGFVYGLFAVAIIVVPFIFVVSALTDRVQIILAWFEQVKVNGAPPLPEWVSTIPIAGEKIDTFYHSIETDPANTLSKYEPQIKILLSKFVSGGAGLVGAVLELIAAVIISAIGLTGGFKSLEPLKKILRNLLGEKSAESVLDASGRAIKGVTNGALGTAIICAIAAWIGYAIIGLNIAGILAAVTFLFVLIQLGPILVLIPVIFWVASQGVIGNTIFITLYGIIVLMGIDNILKPILIGRSGKKACFGFISWCDWRYDGMGIYRNV